MLVVAWALAAMCPQAVVAKASAAGMAAELASRKLSMKRNFKKSDVQASEERWNTRCCSAVWSCVVLRA